MINAIDRVPRQTLYLAGHNHSVAVAGHGPPVVLIHGSATHAYAWRNVIPYLARGHRCLAPDLLGMGGSIPTLLRGMTVSFSFAEQLATIADSVGLLRREGPVVLIGHELGAMLAAQYARENPSSVAGLVFIEGSFRVSNDTRFDADLQEFFTRIRGPEGESMVLSDNLLVEFYLNRLTSRHLGPEEMSVYRYPYRRRGRSREAMLSMIRHLPLQSHPGPIDELAEQVRVWLSRSPIPKLVIGGSPGFLNPLVVLATTAKWANTTVAGVRGLHFLMEDSPARLTSLVMDWLTEIGHVSTPPTDEDEEATELSSHVPPFN